MHSILKSSLKEAKVEMFNSSDIQNDHPTAAGYQTVQKVERTSESKSYPTEGNGRETARISNH